MVRKTKRSVSVDAQQERPQVLCVASQTVQYNGYVVSAWLHGYMLPKVASKIYPCPCNACVATVTVVFLEVGDEVKARNPGSLCTCFYHRPYLPVHVLR